MNDEHIANHMPDHMPDHIMNDELPTLEETLAAGPRRNFEFLKKTLEEKKAALRSASELAAIERAQDALEPPLDRTRVLTLSARATYVHVNAARLTIELSDERQISVPLAWFPRLQSATAEQRSHFELVGQGIGIHWPAIDENISVENLLGTGDRLLLSES